MLNFGSFVDAKSRPKSQLLDHETNFPSHQDKKQLSSAKSQLIQTPIREKSRKSSEGEFVKQESLKVVPYKKIVHFSNFQNAGLKMFPISENEKEKNRSLIHECQSDPLEMHPSKAHFIRSSMKPVYCQRNTIKALSIPEYFETENDEKMSMITLVEDATTMTSSPRKRQNTPVNIKTKDDVDVQNVDQKNDSARDDEKISEEKSQVLQPLFPDYFPLYFSDNNFDGDLTQTISNLSEHNIKIEDIDAFCSHVRATQYSDGNQKGIDCFLSDDES